MRLPKLRADQLTELTVRKTITPDARELRRIQAVMYLDKEYTIDFVIELTGLKRSRIFYLREQYLKIGIKALETSKRKARKLLKPNQLAEIKRTLKNKKPSSIGYGKNINYWTTDILSDYIWGKYKVQYKSKTSYHLIFKESRLTYHKPGKVYEKRDEQETKKWREEILPIIKEGMKEPNTIILCEDEMILSSQTTFQKIWLPVGEYPKIEVSNTRKNQSIYGFLNIKTGKEHAFISDKQNMFITKEKLEKIRKIYPDKKIILIWDGAGWHRGSVVQEYIKQDKNIQLHYFPKYSPEENPQEHVWKKGRSNVTHNKFIKNIKRAAEDFVNYLNNNLFDYKILNCSPVLM